MNFYNDKTNKNIEIYFRAFEFKDTKQFVNCICDYYGDGYPYKQFLDGKFLASRCESGKMLVICGETSSGEIVSTSGINLDTEFKNSGILMLRVVKKDYQNIGIGSKHQNFLFNQLDKIKQLHSVYADVMTINTTSQNGLVNENFVYTGIRLMLYHKKIMLPKCSSVKDFKLSQAVMCKNISYDTVDKIYCPKIHSEFVNNIYKKLGVNCEIETSINTPKTENSHISFHSDSTHNHLQLLIFKVGNDFEKQIQKQILKYSNINEQTYICYLNMKDYSSVFAYNILCQLGFFFCGIKPLNDNGEFMILSKVTEGELDFEKIKLHKNGEYIKQYILKSRKMGDTK